MINRVYRFSIEFLLFVFCFGFSQTPTLNEIKSVVENMGESSSNTDIVKQIQNSGLDNNLKDFKGILEKNDVQKDNIRENEIEIIENIQESNNSVNKSSNTESGTDLIEPEDKLNESQEVLDLIDLKGKNSPKKIFSNQTKSKYFGYSTFKTNPDFFNKSVDLSASPDYIIGPGDEIIIMLWGQTEDQTTYTVTKDGYIFVKNIGQIFVNGLNLEKLEKKLKKIFKKAYSSISPENDRSPTYFDVSLGSIVLKPIRVFIMGEVNNPGAYEMKSTATLFSSLYYFNGPKLSGSLRDIHLIREGKKVASIDFYDFLIRGKKKNDVDLMDGDIVFIPLRNKTVSVEGEVNRPSIFELKEKENYSDLMNFFGGYLSTTYLKRAKINRINPIKERMKTGKDRILLDIDLYSLKNKNDEFSVLDGDSFTFFKIFDFVENSVNINGPVKRPGNYSLEKSLTILDLIEKADGLSSSDIFWDRADIFRKLPNNKESLLSFNLDSILLGVEDHNIQLQAGDQLNIYKNSDMISSNDVRIIGYVKNPGVKKYREKMTVADLIFEGGGFQDQYRLGNTFLGRADLYRYDTVSKKVDLISFNLDSVLAGKGIAQKLLKMGDRIRVYRKTDILGETDRFVYIDGFVKYPGQYEYAENMTLADILFISSGLKDKNRMDKIFFKRADMKRLNEYGQYEILLKLDLEKLLSNNEEFMLAAGDRITIYSNALFEDKRQIVTVSGLVNKPGQYTLIEGMNIGDVILAAGGLLGKNEEFRVEVSSLNFEGPKQKSIVNSFIIKNLSDNFIDKKNSTLNKVLYDNDFISIFSKNDISHHTVTMNGEINYPGEYVLPDRESKLFDIIERAGGLTEYANDVASYLVRDGERISLRLDKIQKSKRSKYNISLINGDIITFGRKTAIVKINGEVATPGVYQYVKGLSSKDYIDLAGGYSKDAARQGATVIYPNGFSSKIGLFKDPMVMDGSEIIVLKKQEVKPFSFTEYVSSLTAVYSDLIQAYTLILLINTSNNN